MKIRTGILLSLLLAGLFLLLLLWSERGAVQESGSIRIRTEKAATEQALRTGGDGREAPLPLEEGETVALNSATAAQLQRLPGVDAALAAAIVADREENGPFYALEELCRVKGVEEALLQRLQGYITMDGKG